jgi:nucleoside-diphosphate-sugar epimerase
MNVLITGGNGYIAKSLYNGLKHYNITTITRSDFDLTNRTATDKWFEGKHFDAVIHTAIKGGSRLKQDDGNTFYQNLQMFYNLYYNKHCYSKFIYFGSGAELGTPNDPYGLSKKIINDLIKFEHGFFNIRIFGIFDENELETRFIKNNIKNYLNKKPITIHQNKYMDFFYMGDFINLVNDYIVGNPYTSLAKTTECSYIGNTTPKLKLIGFEQGLKNTFKNTLKNGTLQN